MSHLSVTRDERISSLLVGKDRHRSRHLTRPCSTWDTRYLDPRTTYRAAIDTTRTFPPSLCPDLTIKENHPGTRLSPSSRVANIPTHYRNPDTFRHHTQRVGCARGVEGECAFPSRGCGAAPHGHPTTQTQQQTQPHNTPPTTQPPITAPTTHTQTFPSRRDTQPANTPPET